MNTKKNKDNTPLQIIETTARISQKRPLTTCIFAGIASAFAMPPFHLFPVLFLSFTTLFLCFNQKQTYKQAFLKGFLFALGFHVAGLYWVANALLVHGWTFAWAYPLAIFGLPAFFALYGGFAGIAYKVLKKSHPIINIILFSVLWILSEYARGNVFGGFPWNLVGYTWATTPFLPVLQSVSIFGIYGLSFLTIIGAVIPALLFIDKSIYSKLFSAFIAVIFATIAVWGWNRIENNQTAFLDDVTVRLVQANIPQKDKWDSKQLVENFNTHVFLSSEDSQTRPNIIIWPETAIPFIIKRDVYFKQYLRDMLDKNSILISGILDIEKEDSEDKPRIYNRVTAWNSKGEEIYHFNKFHLVPFGEYMPLGKYLPVNPVASGGLEFSAGSGLDTAKINNWVPPFSPLICYEVLFPSEVSLHGDKRPEWILNVTNDGWYGYSTGPFQHLAIARTRAVEEGLPLVRSAGTGISAVIDPVGRIVDEIPLQTLGILDSKLPKKISPTIYSKFFE